MEEKLGKEMLRKSWMGIIRVYGKDWGKAWERKIMRRS
jgi:hypothetical protein